MGDKERVFTLEDAVLCAQRKCGELLDVDLTRSVAIAHCPHANHKDSKKLTIKFNEGWFNCIKCQQTGQHQPSGGGPVSLFMHVTGITDCTEAAREMHEILGDESTTKAVAKKQRVKEPEPKKIDIADIDVRDHTYRTLLSLLVLSTEHRSALLARGLTGDQIDRFGYKSLPRDRKAICKKLLQMGCILEGVPGFYKDKDSAWTMNVFGTGIFVPWVNAKGQIEFLQIRKDKADPLCRNCSHCEDGKCLSSGRETDKSSTCDSFKEKGMRYFTFSSPDKECGSGARTWIHGRKGEKADSWKEVFITEGALKADVASAISGKNFLAVQGVGNTGDLPRVLHNLHYKGLEKVYLCYDNEPDNPAVLRGEASIKEMLEVLRVPYQKVAWDELGLKGIDDWLAAKQK